jgi:chorismate-pyruvate lyase
VLASRTTYAHKPFSYAYDIFEYEETPSDEVPPPYDQLLVHEHHMTVTVEAFHGSLVNVHPLNRLHAGNTYARRIILTTQKSGQVVLYGIVRLDLSFCSPAVKDEILGGQTPLGRILIQHDVLRRIEPTAYLRILPGPGLMEVFRMQQPKSTFGRTAIIHCNGQPAIELLEIVAPA